MYMYMYTVSTGHVNNCLISRKALIKYKWEQKFSCGHMYMYAVYEDIFYLKPIMAI